VPSVSAADIATGLLPNPVGASRIMHLYPEANAESISLKTFPCLSLSLANEKFLIYLNYFRLAHFIYSPLTMIPSLPAGFKFIGSIYKAPKSFINLAICDYVSCIFLGSIYLITTAAVYTCCLLL